jgi:uncharacterized protein (TIGR03663 family)
MSSRARLPLILLLVLVIARFYDLEIRPPHHDEAVNGWFVDGMFKKGFYQYDPHNYHGPLYFYFLAFSEMLFGRSLHALRFVTVFFGALLTFIPFLYRRWIGEKAAWIGAFVLALSPAVVFYSRYAIHEVPFSFFTALFFYFWLRAREEEFSWKILLGLGLSLGTLACLKENFVIFLGCLFIAEVMTRVYGKEFKFPKKYSYYAGMSLIGFLIVAVVYSAFGRDPDGISNFFQAFNFWSETGTKGNGHQKPFEYWFKVFGSYEWATLIGVFLSVLALKKVPSPIRLLSVMSMGLLMAYSIVNYKTPWCLLSFQWGFVLIFAYWCSQYWKKYQTWIMILFGIIAVQSAYQAIDVSYVNVDSENSYYIYGQTYRDIMPPIQKILDQVRADSVQKNNIKIQIISGYTWPLPFLLGELNQVAYHNEQNAPERLDADYVFIDESLEAKFAMRIMGSYSREVYRARQWASPMVIFKKQ